MPRTVLLADDSVTIQTAVGMIFATEDVTLLIAKDGEEALVKARAQKPDLLLADVRMPKFSGFELCTRFHAEAGMDQVPVLLLGGEGPVDPAKVQAAGANGHLPKPFDSTKLLDFVKQLFANPQARPTQTLPPPAAASRAAVPLRRTDRVPEALVSGSVPETSVDG